MHGCMCVCMGAFVCVNLCMGASVCVCDVSMCVCDVSSHPEAKVGCLFPYCSLPYFLIQGISLDLELAVLGRLAGQSHPTPSWSF